VGRPFKAAAGLLPAFIVLVQSADWLVQSADWKVGGRLESPTLQAGNE